VAGIEDLSYHTCICCSC